MSDIFGFELEDGLASGACPLCHAVAAATHRWLDSFSREEWQAAAARAEFYAGGGFCARHAWLLHDLPGARPEVAIADVYARLAERDLATLDAVLARSSRRRGRPGWQTLRRGARCPACVDEDAALERKAYFFAGLLATDAGRRRYERARGVCFPHLLTLLEAAGDDEALVRYLLEDWRRRLDDLRRRLEQLDRTRDHRFAHERREEDERSWTDVLHHYAGMPP